jgi:ATP-binding cassette subfamily C protein CydCD
LDLLGLPQARRRETRATHLLKLDRRLLHLIKPVRLVFYLTIALGFAGGILAVLQARLMSQVVSRVFLGEDTLAGVASVLGVLLIAIILRAGVTGLAEVASHHLAIRIKGDLRARLFSHLQARGPVHFLPDHTTKEGQRTGELVTTAVEGIEALEAYFSQYLPQVVLAALLPLIILAFILPLDPLSTLVLFLTAPLIPIFMILIADRAETMTRQRWRSLSRMSAYFLDILQGLPTLKMLGRSRDQVQVISQVSRQFRNTTMDVLRVAFLSALILEWVATLSTAIVAVEIGLRLLYGRLTFEQAFFVLLLAPEFYLPLRMLGARFHAGMPGVQAAQRIFQILEEPPTQPVPSLDEPGISTPLPKPAAPGVHFKRVSFNYPDSRQALREVTLEIPAGQKVALAGPSGAGKSTLTYLLLGFLNPVAGSIRVDRTDLKDIPTDQWLQQVSWVPQNPYLFNDTVENNLRLARPQASEMEIVTAARLAYADEFIRQLPQGYQTVIGERGARLSAGQAQRLALARAFLKDAPFLILDEPTANLDPYSESLIQQALQRLTQRRTVLVIAHRLQTLAGAVHVILLDRGRVVAQGDHATLVGQSDLYRKFLRARQEFGSDSSGVDRPTYPPLPPSAARFGAPLPWDGTKQAESGSLPTSQLVTLKRLTGLLSPFKVEVLLAVLLGVATIGSGIGLMATSAYLIAAAALVPSIAALQVAIVGVRAFGLTRGIFRYLERLVSHNLTFRLLASLRVTFYMALEPLAPARLMRYPSGDLLSRVTRDLDSLENFFVRGASPPLIAGLVTVLATVFMAAYHPTLAGALLASLLLGALGLPAVVSRLSKGTGEHIIHLGGRLNTALIDGIQGMPDLILFRGQTRQAGKVDHLSRELGRAQARMARIHGLHTAGLNFLPNLSLWVILILAIPLVRAGQIEVVYLAALCLTALTSFEAIIPLPAAAQYLAGNLEAGARLFELVDAQPEVQEPRSPLPLPARFDLRVSGLRFRYPAFSGTSPQPQDLWVLDGIHFSLEQGQRKAIVGPSGAGKTTLLNLLLRFWEFQEGAITLGGTELRRLDGTSLRQNIAMASQNPYLFNATVRDNLRLANPGATGEQIYQAAQQAQIHARIQSWPDGYDTWIGEGGLRLSGGERQRLALARVLLKDAPLLILDEPVTNLDPVTGRLVLESILAQIGGRTILLVTHQLVGMQLLDEILVLDAGRIVERGSHTELLIKGGLYHHMWQLQNQDVPTNLQINPCSTRKSVSK